MLRDKDPFVIQIEGGDINDRDLAGFSDRRYEGTGIPARELTSLRRVINPSVTKFSLLALVVVIGVLFTRLVWLQVARGQEYRSVAEGNRIRLEVLSAPRGLIVDRQGKPLVANVPNFILVVVPADLPKDLLKRQEVLKELTAVLLPEEINNLTDKFDYRSYQPVIIKSQLDYYTGLSWITKTSRLPGIQVKVASQRQYLLADNLAHVLGYVSVVSPEDLGVNDNNYQYDDVIGVTGIEVVYEDELRGTPGKQEVEVDNLGRPRQVFASINPVAGATITLTVDSELQEVVVNSVNKLLTSYDRKKGAVVALEPTTGEVLALASFPTFNPNFFTIERSNNKTGEILTHENQPLFNRAISGEYPSGSTIKPVIGAAALEEKVITTNTTFISTGGVWAGNRWFADWKAEGHGATNIYKAIAESVNTFFYLISGGSDEREGLGATKLVDYLNKFHFAKIFGIDLPGEAAGLVPDPEWKQETFGERWFRGDTYNLAIGQGNFLTTPLQLAVVYSALVNGGTLWKPHLTKMISEGRRETIISQPESLGTIPISKDNLDIIKRSLRETVLSGSARSLQSVPLAAAGKTGTAQSKPGLAPHAWFAGFLPYEQPKLVLVVLFENGGESSSLAVPVALEVFNWYATNRL
ncbi:MAG: penicillin-binding protein 2 [Patescibacteria group bacterium]